MNRLPRFELRHPIVDGVAIVDGDELHHLRDVMRLRQGAAVALIAGQLEHTGRIESLEADRALVRIESTVSMAHTPTLILATAIIKGPRMDYLVEKAAELGVTELWPLLCERSVVRDPGFERLARWQRLASAAAKQSLAPAALQIRKPAQFTDLIETYTKDRLADDQAMLRLICVQGAEPIATVMHRNRPHGLVIVCGPEGDFTEAELAFAKVAGFVGVGLGNNRLRSETAAIAAVAIAGALLERPD